MCVCHECLSQVLRLSVRKNSLENFTDERYITALLLLQLLRVKETPKSIIHLLKHSMICWYINWCSLFSFDVIFPCAVVHWDKLKQK